MILSNIFKYISINAKNNDGDTALILASRCIHINIVKLLLKFKANSNVKNNDGYTALTLASINGYTDIVKILLKNKANIDAKTNDGYTALMFASFNEHKDIVKLLRNEHIRLIKRSIGDTFCLDINGVIAKYLY